MQSKLTTARGRLLVKVGGEICLPPHLDAFALQVKQLQDDGFPLVVVHGGGPQMNDWLKRLAIERRMVAGRRITDAPTLEVAKGVLRGVVNADLVSKLRGVGVRSVGLSGIDGALVSAHRRPPREVVDDEGRTRLVDFGYVGDLESIDSRLLEDLLGNGWTPVIASLGGDSSGGVYNVNADTIASALAQTLGAEKLITLSGVPGVLRNPSDHSTLVPMLNVAEVEALAREGVVKGGMLPKTSALVEAIKRGVPEAWIVSGTEPGALLKAVKERAGGTCITA